MDNVNIATVGAADNGNDYFVVTFAAATNSLVVRNSHLGGLRSNTKVHGINLGTNTMGSTIIQNCVFNFLNDSITSTTNNRVILTGSTSFNTNQSGTSVDLRGTGSMVYVSNYWDVQPTALLQIVSN